MGGMVVEGMAAGGMAGDKVAEGTVAADMVAADMAADMAVELGSHNPDSHSLFLSLSNKFGIRFCTIY